MNTIKNLNEILAKTTPVPIKKEVKKDFSVPPELQEWARMLQMPPTSGNVKMPPTSGNVKMPPTSGNVKMPPISGNVKMPPTSGNVKMPTTSGNVNCPPKKRKNNRKRPAGKWLKDHPFMQVNDISSEVPNLKGPSLPLSHVEEQGPSKILRREEQTVISNCGGPVNQQLLPNMEERLKGQERTGSPSNVDQSLDMAIIDKFHPGIMLNQQQAAMIEDKILEALDTIHIGSGCPPQFEEFRFTSGILWFLCANVSTKAWLMTTVRKLNNLWEGANIIIVDAKNVPERPKVLVRLPEATDFHIIRNRLARQNPFLNVQEWRLLNRRVEKIKQLLVFSIDSASFSSLQMFGFKAYYGLRTIVFKHIEDQHIMIVNSTKT